MQETAVFGLVLFVQSLLFYHRSNGTKLLELSYEINFVVERIIFYGWCHTIVCWIVVSWTFKSHRSQEGDKTLNTSLVYALSLSQRVQVVKHFKQPRTRLVNGAYDGTSTASKRLEKGEALETR